MIPKVKINDFVYQENQFQDNGRIYKVTDLIAASEHLPEFDLPLCGIDLANTPWGNLNTKSFIYHMKRVEEAELQYPILLSDTGYPCDGWHRIVKAILEGRTTIKAKRFDIMPDCYEFVQN